MEPHRQLDAFRAPERSCFTSFLADDVDEMSLFAPKLPLAVFAYWSVVNRSFLYGGCIRIANFRLGNIARSSAKKKSAMTPARRIGLRSRRVSLAPIRRLYEEYPSGYYFLLFLV